MRAEKSFIQIYPLAEPLRCQLYPNSDYVCGENKGSTMMRSFIIGAAILLTVISGGFGELAAQTQPNNPGLSSNNSLVIPKGNKFIMELETPIHTSTCQEADRVEFVTAAEILVDKKIIIPNRSTVHGIISKCKRAGRISGRAEVHLKIGEIQLADGSLLPLSATITRVGFDPVDSKEGEDPEISGDSGESGGVGSILKSGAEGAVIGVLTGGSRGAMYGSGAAAAVTAVRILFERGPDVDLPRLTMFEAMFEESLEVPVEALPRYTQVAESRPPEKPPEWSIRIPKEEPPLPEISETPRPVLRRPESAPAGDLSSSTPEAAPPAAVPGTLPPDSSGSDIAGSTGGFTLSVNVRVVQVDAVVRDRDGRMVGNLAREDFAVFEDGVRQEIQSFSQDELPLAVALVIDRSGSISPYIAELRRIATRALEQLKPTDEVTLFSFADDVRMVEALTADRERIASGIARIRTGGGTNIVDAVYESVGYLARTAPERRHAVILLSDNQATVQPQASESGIIRKAMESETVIYSIKTAGQGSTLAVPLPSFLTGAGSVGRITKETGGEIIDAKKVDALDTALASVIARLRMRYSMSYHPPETSQVGAFHSIEVKLTAEHGEPGKDYRVHARRGYYSTSGRIR
jgi:VWFA-related protein